MINKSFREYFNLVKENSLNILHNKNINQRAFHTEINRYSNQKDNIGKVFICVDTNTKDSLPLGIIGECVDSILDGRYLKFHFDSNFYKSEYFRELRNTFGYAAEELREIEWIEGCKVVDIENNLFTKNFLNSPLSSSALDKILSSITDKEHFVENFNPKNSYHRLVNNIINK